MTLGWRRSRPSDSRSLVGTPSTQLCCSFDTVRDVSVLIFAVGAVICIAWGCALMLFPGPITRSARKAEGDFWGRQITPELTRFIGCGFLLGGLIAAVTLVVGLLRH